MRIALATLIPTLLVAYLSILVVAGAWHERRRMHPAARGMLWVGLAQATIGFGVVILWGEVLAFHHFRIPDWGAKVYAPAVETVAILDAISVACAAINHAIVRVHRGQPIFPDWMRADPEDVGEIVGSPDYGGTFGRGGGGGLGAADMPALDLGAGSGGDWFPSFGLGLDLGEDGALLFVGIGLFLLAALVVASSLLGGAGIVAVLLRHHAGPEPARR